jgi:predicted nucleic acid-binding protein
MAGLGFGRRRAGGNGSSCRFLQVWGTLRILLEAKAQGLTDAVEPSVWKLSKAGMWISAEVRQRILVLTGEG